MRSFAWSVRSEVNHTVLQDLNEIEWSTNVYNLLLSTSNLMSCESLLKSQKKMFDIV